jgi:hypothetical protein
MSKEYLWRVKLFKSDDELEERDIMGDDEYDVLDRLSVDGLGEEDICEIEITG